MGTHYMIVCFQPGGTIKDKRVVIKWSEKIPWAFNTPETVIFRESEDNPQDWILVKPKGEVLPIDSPLLADQQVITESTILDLTKQPESASIFEHRDIIRMDDPEETKSDG